MHPSNKKSLQAVAALVACALGAATVASAAEPKSKKTEEQQIKALQESLLAVQMQLKQLADQNQSLMQHQQQLEQQLAQQQLALQKAQADASARRSLPRASGSDRSPGRSAPQWPATARHCRATQRCRAMHGLPARRQPPARQVSGAPPTANTSGFRIARFGQPIARCAALGVWCGQPG